jgi:hypothetical protein
MAGWDLVVCYKSFAISAPDTAAGFCASTITRRRTVAFWVEHHDMTKVLTVGLLADIRSPGGDQLGRFRTDELLALGHVPWRLACHPDVDVHPVLGCLALRPLRKPMAGPTPSGSTMEAPSGSLYPGSAIYPSAIAQNAAIPCGSAASQSSVQCVAMPAKYRRAR